jgi:starch phosphorylase
MPEALEKWPLTLMEATLPRHVEIIKRIDLEFIEGVKKSGAFSAGEVDAAIASMSILENYYVEEEPEKPAAKATEKEEEEEEEEAAPPPPVMVRMANLCCIAGFAVNGVAAIHSEIVKNIVFNDFYKLWPEKFQNKTNGVTPRRWLAFCNPDLSAVITKWLGSDEWIQDADKLEGLRNFADNGDLQKEWRDAKLGQKVKLQGFIKETFGEDISTDAIFDIQVKRIHEYKRQLLNILGIVYRYKQMKAMSPEERAKCVPHVAMIGGKAYATYTQAKRIVNLVNRVGKVINNDPEIGDLLKVFFLPNYNVSLAEKIIPASEISQHISTAGTEASGTSNMKFAMNGCLIIGTLDGANVEIRECVGEENFFLFGCEEHEVEPLREERRLGKFEPDPRFTETMDYIKTGIFGDFSELLGSLEGNEGFGCGDYFLVGYDFPTYIDAMAEVHKAYRDQTAWTKSSILSTAGSGQFSSDRTIDQYAKEIWGVEPCRVPDGRTE